MFDKVENKSEYAAFFIAKIMKIIVDNYYKEVTYEELYNAAINGITDKLDEYSIFFTDSNFKNTIDEYYENSYSMLNSPYYARSNSIKDYFLSEVCKFDAVGKYNNIKLIKMQEINSNTANELEKLIKKLQGENITYIILDLRDNFGGRIDYTVEICNLLVRKSILFNSYDKYKVCTTYSTNLIKKPFDRIIVLTNKRTKSAAELIASVLQSDDNIVIGQKTYGKGLSQKTYKIINGGTLILTTNEFFKNNNEPINNIGITPNIIVESPVVDNNKDVILEKAYKYLANILCNRSY